jgi:hypothetical protein
LLAAISRALAIMLSPSQHRTITSTPLSKSAAARATHHSNSRRCVAPAGRTVSAIRHPPAAYEHEVVVQLEGLDRHPVRIFGFAVRRSWTAPPHRRRRLLTRR